MRGSRQRRRWRKVRRGVPPVPSPPHRRRFPGGTCASDDDGDGAGIPEHFGRQTAGEGPGSAWQSWPPIWTGSPATAAPASRIAGGHAITSTAPRARAPRRFWQVRRRSGGAVHRPIARHDRAARPVGPCPISAFFPNPAKQLAESTSGIPRMTPKRTQRFSGLLQDWREVWMATSSSGSPDDGRGADLAIFTGIWTHSSCRLLLNA